MNLLKAFISRSSGWSTYQRLLCMIKPYWMMLCFGMLATILGSFIDAAFIWLIDPIVNKGLVSRDLWFIRIIPLLVIGIFILRGVTNFISNYYISRAARYIVMDLRQKFFRHLLRLPARFYDHHSSGSLLSTIIYNVEQVASASSEALIISLRDASLLCGLLIVMFMTSWLLTLFFFMIGPLIFFVMKYCSQRLRQLSVLVQKSVSDVTHRVSEALEAYRVIRLGGGQSYEDQKFCEATKCNQQHELKVVMTSTVSSALVQLLMSIPIAILLFFSTHPMFGFSVGSFAAFISALVMILRPMRRLTMVNTYIQKGIAGAESIFQILDEPVERDPGQRASRRVAGLITYEGVSFTYAHTTRSVLDHIGFSIQPGQTVALVGRSGSGKSTLASLLPRFYDPSCGRIAIDGIDIQDFPLANLRDQIAMVSQDVKLFNDTIANNISYGYTGAYAEEKLMAAAEAAQLMEFIAELPDGLHTRIGENGVLLSGGQGQRIAIARALFKNAPILILDEPTAALDQQTEYHIQAAIHALIGTRTTLVIAHRLSTIENADHILVLEGGRIVEQGTHQALLQDNQIYAELYQNQFYSMVSS